MDIGIIQITIHHQILLPITKECFYLEIPRALRGLGPYRLAPGYQHFFEGNGTVGQLKNFNQLYYVNKHVGNTCKSYHVAGLKNRRYEQAEDVDNQRSICDNQNEQKVYR
uniref:Uncharacterized protein n=1 Tax=Clytia hemisphaerica TaxID=252671 RepID=A0A7M5UME9_9CNID